VQNSEWLSDMRLDDFLKLAAKVTAAQILAREDFDTRLKENRPISLHELFYPLMQGYDSVQIDADIELGGSDQRFNNLMGRDLQVAYGRTHKDSQMVLLMPLLEGTDGKIKMSKSYPDNCINLTDSAEDMYGKLMSIPDAMIARYEILLNLLSEEQLQEQQDQIQSGAVNPRDIKMHLAKFLVSQYHSVEETEAAEQAFITKFQKRDIPDDLPELQVSAGSPLSLTTLMIDQQMAPSKNEARRLIQGGGVKLDGEKVTELEHALNYATGSSVVLQVGKRRFLRLNFN
jgi:tyrosyl-tRNA synthetase